MYSTITKDILRVQNNEDEEALTRIIQENSGLVWSLVKRFLGRGYSRWGVIPGRSYSDL